MPLVEIAGDLFASDAPALAQGCNCAGAMGRGIAVEFRRRWPEMYEHYRTACRSGNFTLGEVLVWEEPDRTIFNLGTQRTWRTGATLAAIASAFETMIVCAKSADIDYIGMPRIGSGLGGLDWKDVRHVLVDLVPDDVTVVVYSLTRSG